MRKIIYGISVFTINMMLAGCGHEHTWTPYMRDLADHPEDYAQSYMSIYLVNKGYSKVMNWNIPFTIISSWLTILPLVNPHSSSACGKGIDKLCM